ncbi:hypothetical protein KY284_030220 [Solanum tuberosum]|nr:hypothetical protein KY284_030220 [Solanum tuberosum]
MVRKKRQSRAPPPLEPKSPKSIGTSERHVTPATRILQALEPLQLSSWISGKESALSILWEMTKSVTLTPCRDWGVQCSSKADLLSQESRRNIYYVRSSSREQIDHHGLSPRLLPTGGE